MAESKANSRTTGMNVDTALVRELADLLADTGLTEIVTSAFQVMLDEGA